MLWDTPEQAGRYLPHENQVKYCRGCESISCGYNVAYAGNQSPKSVRPDLKTLSCLVAMPASGTCSCSPGPLTNLLVYYKGHNSRMAKGNRWIR